MRPCAAIRLGFAPEAGEVRRALSEACRRLSELGLDEGDLGVAELVLAEVLNNVVEHAFPAGAAGRIEVRLRAGERALACEVRDSGLPMPAGDLPAGRSPLGEPGRVAVGDLPEGGFGWHLVRRLATGLDYRRAGSVNRLRFHVPYGSAAIAGEPRCRCHERAPIPSQGRPESRG